MLKCWLIHLLIFIFLIYIFYFHVEGTLEFVVQINISNQLRFFSVNFIPERHELHAILF